MKRFSNWFRSSLKKKYSMQREPLREVTPSDEWVDKRKKYERVLVLMGSKFWPSFPRNYSSKLFRPIHQPQSLLVSFSLFWPGCSFVRFGPEAIWWRLVTGRPQWEATGTGKKLQRKSERKVLHYRVEHHTRFSSSLDSHLTKWTQHWSALFSRK